MLHGGINEAEIVHIRVQYAYDNDPEKKFFRQFYKLSSYNKWLNHPAQEKIHVIQLAFRYDYPTGFVSVNDKCQKVEFANQMLNNYEKLQKSIW